MNKIFLILLVIPVTILLGQEAFPNYLNPNISSKQRVEDLLNRMTIEEKIGQMDQYLAPSFVKKNTWGGNYDSTIAKLQKGLIGSLLFVKDEKEANELQKISEATRLKIPLLIGIDAIHGHALYEGATVFPTEIGIASSWNKNIANQIAKSTAQEMRATGFHWTFSPNIDICRDPRWGRSGETFGEDPYLVSEMGKAMILGYQQKDGNEIPKEGVLACAKHFAAGGQPQNGINFSPMEISERMLRSDFLYPFEEAVKSGVETFMAAHNEISGIPCHSSEYLLTNILRNEWNYDGLVVSDWLDMEALYKHHKVAVNLKDAFKQSLDAGLNMHMYGDGFFANVKELAEEGKIDTSVINNSVRKILLAKFKLNLFENRYVDEKEASSKLLTKENKEIALNAALESIVLLKNNNDILPINKENKVFITGPTANHHGAIVGDWVGKQPLENIVTPIEGIYDLVKNDSKIDYHEIHNLLEISDEDINESVIRAKKSDVAIIFVGGNNNRTIAEDRTGGENIARSDLRLVGRQLELVKKIVETKTPTIVVLINGRPLAIPWIAENVESIIEAWEPGMEGGTAIAKLIYGDVNPSGKLPITIPRSVGHLQYWYNHKPTVNMHNYQFSDNTPIFEFGHGLSYSEFGYNKLVVAPIIFQNDSIEVLVEVENKSNIPGKEVIQIFITDKVSSVTTPVKKLVAFEKLYFKAYEKKEVNIKIDQSLLSLYDRKMNKVIEDGTFQIHVGNLTKEFEIKNEK